MRSAQMCTLKSLGKVCSVTLIFDGLHWCWIRLTIDTEWSNMLRASCKHTHDPCSCNSNIFSVICVSWLHVLWVTFFLLITAQLNKRRKEILGQTEMEMRQAFFMQNCYILCHCVRAPLLWGNWGVWSAFPHWDECVWVKEKTLAGVSVGLSSSSLPVGQEDRDRSLSAGLWLDPSP